MNANVDYIIKTAIGEFNYLDYEGQHITATNSIEGRARSAILSGQTLNNIALTINNTIHKNAGIVVTKPSLYDMAKRYIVMFDVVEKPDTLYMKLEGAIGGTWQCDLSSQKLIDSVGRYYLISSVSSVQHKQIKLTNASSSSERCIVANVVVIEYQDGMENWDIPYFEGMQSVKAPTVSTVGKNVVNEKIWKIEAEEEGYQCLLSAGWATETTKSGNPIIIPVHVEKGKVYTLKCKNKATRHFNDFYFMDDLLDGKAKSFRKSFGRNKTLDSFVDTIITFRADRDYKYLQIDTGEPDANGYIVKNTLQLEEGSVATAYEPYKSNILTVNEDVELRGIGDVKDELDCLTGEVTERIGEIVLDGSEGWNINNLAVNNKVITFTGRIISDAKVIPNVVNYTSDKIASLRNELWASDEVEGFLFMNNKQLAIKIKRETASTSEELVTYLSQNPITIQYQLETESIKTVDLSDNHVYSYKGITHYSCSSEERSLVPTLSVKVPTDTQLTIQEQKATTQTLLIKNMDLQQSIKEVQAMNLAFNTALYNSFNSIREEVEDIKKHVSTNENLEGSF